MLLSDAGETQEDCFCGVCKTKMDVQRNVMTARSWAGSMAGIKALCDVYTCPFKDEQWHKQVIAITIFAEHIPSANIEDMCRREVAEILRNRKPTKENFDHY